MKNIFIFIIGAVTFAGVLSALENPRIIPFDSDAETGISTNKTYTHAVDFGTLRHDPPLKINGVEFFTTTAPSMPGDKTPRGCGWENFPPNPNHPNPETTMTFASTPTGQCVRLLLTGMTWNLQNKTMRLTDLQPGFEYELRFYNRSYGSAKARGQTFFFKPQGEEPGAVSTPFSFYQDDPETGDNMLVYRYRVGANGKLAIFVEQWDNVYTWHAYGFTNEEMSKNIIVTGIENIGGTKATVKGEIYTAGAETEVKALWGNGSGEPSDNDDWNGGLESVGVFKKDSKFDFVLDGLLPGAEYRIWLKASNTNSVVWSNPMNFTTSN
ncbi:MAG: hypothetical protein FWG05_05190 [Kiritimatiellaeota bacterium]|nr:hypothetical protein [Kiritimatiellota bacterium]